MTEETRMILEELKTIKRDIQDIQITLEHETNRNIRLIAEGHMNLERKLDEALKINNEKEMLLIRVNSMENEIRRIKARIEEIA